jgi:rSAM/selenodomain-associated transferase 2
VHQTDNQMNTPRSLSIIIPVLNEALTIGPALKALGPLRDNGAEVIVVDGTSTDDTIARAEPLADRVLVSAKGRGRQLQAGATAAQGRVFLFLHADKVLPPDADQLIFQAIDKFDQSDQPVGWGRFDVRITGQHWMLPVISHMMNLRSRLTGIATGDQAMFVSRALYERVGGFSDQPLMEDIELSRRLYAQKKPVCLRQRVLTSGRRWERNGVWQTIALMWCLRWRYWRGESAVSLSRDYS